MGTDVKDIMAVGIIPLETREFLQGGGTGDPPVCIRGMGNVPQDWE